jgi:hypothetical protein
MSSHEKRPLTDDDPTVEEEAPDFFDPTRTDRMNTRDFASARHDATGVIEHDERGHARWVSLPEAPVGDTDKTFDELRALTNEKLAIDDAEAAAPTPSSKSGYNPYDTNVTPPPANKKQR